MHILASSEAPALLTQAEGQRANVSCLFFWQQCWKNSLLIRTTDTNGITRVCPTALTEKCLPTAFFFFARIGWSEINTSQLVKSLAAVFFFFGYKFLLEKSSLLLNSQTFCLPRVLIQAAAARMQFAATPATCEWLNLF